MTSVRIAAWAMAMFVIATANAAAQTPQVVRYSGVIRDAQGAPRTGVVSLALRLYMEPDGGVPLFLESQSVTLDTEGRYTVLLGSTLREGLPLELFRGGDAKWLGVQADGEAESPRVMLVSVPYALKAADADTVGGKPVSAFVLADDTTTRTLNVSSQSVSAMATSGTAGYLGVFTSSTDLGNSSIFETDGKIGVGTATPEASFHAIGRQTPGAFFDVYNDFLGALPVVFRAARGTPEAPTAVQTNDILGGLAVRGYATTGFPGGKGQVMFKAAENWTDSATGTYLQFTTTPIGSSAFAERMRIAPDGNIGINTSSPAHKLSVAGSIQSLSGGFVFPDGTTQTTAASGSGSGVTSISAGSGILVGGTASAPTVGANFAGASGDFGALNTLARGDHAHDARYLRLTGGALSSGLTINGNVGIGTAAPAFRLDVVGAVRVGTATSLITLGAGANIGMFISSGERSSLSILNTAIEGSGIYSRADEANGVGVFGSASDNPTGTAIVGYQRSLQGWAGVFDGDVNVLGFLYKGGGAFKIDHPLDPENKTLSHSFVESPDMKNIYDGMATLDESGGATVALPEWFEALNKDFRYQLTPIGGPFVPYISEEISGNQFRIAGGVPGKKVSWQVTGIRHDAFANTHRLQVEELKPDDAVGTYLHPEAFAPVVGADAVTSRGQKTAEQKVKDEKARLRAISSRKPPVK